MAVTSTENREAPQSAPKKRVFAGWNIVSLAIVVFIAVSLVRVFLFEAFFVQGDSMAPTINSGELVFVNRLAYLWSEPKRGDIIVAIPRVYPGRVVKRVIGLPGEWFSIENGKIIIRNSRTDEGVNLDEKYLQLPDTPAVGTTRTNIDPKEYFALGDNRAVSIDSRELGAIDLWSIKGKVIGSFSWSTFRFKGF